MRETAVNCSRSLAVKMTLFVLLLSFFTLPGFALGGAPVTPGTTLPGVIDARVSVKSIVGRFNNSVQRISAARFDVAFNSDVMEGDSVLLSRERVTHSRFTEHFELHCGGMVDGGDDVPLVFHSESLTPSRYMYALQPSVIEHHDFASKVQRLFRNIDFCTFRADGDYVLSFGVATSSDISIETLHACRLVATSPQSVTPLVLTSSGLALEGEVVFKAAERRSFCDNSPMKIPSLPELDQEHSRWTDIKSNVQELVGDATAFIETSLEVEASAEVRTRMTTVATSFFKAHGEIKSYLRAGVTSRQAFAMIVNPILNETPVELAKALVAAMTQPLCQILYQLLAMLLINLWIPPDQIGSTGRLKGVPSMTAPPNNIMPVVGVFSSLAHQIHSGKMDPNGGDDLNPIQSADEMAGAGGGQSETDAKGGTTTTGRDVEGRWGEGTGWETWLRGGGKAAGEGSGHSSKLAFTLPKLSGAAKAAKAKAQAMAIALGVAAGMSQKELAKAAGLGQQAPPKGNAEGGGGGGGGGASGASGASSGDSSGGGDDDDDNDFDASSGGNRKGEGASGSASDGGSGSGSAGASGKSGASGSNSAGGSSSDGSSSSGRGGSKKGADPSHSKTGNQIPKPGGEGKLSDGIDPITHLPYKKLGSHAPDGWGDMKRPSDFDGKKNVWNTDRSRGKKCWDKHTKLPCDLLGKHAPDGWGDHLKDQTKKQREAAGEGGEGGGTSEGEDAFSGEFRFHEFEEADAFIDERLDEPSESITKKMKQKLGTMITNAMLEKDLPNAVDQLHTVMKESIIVITNRTVSRGLTQSLTNTITQHVSFGLVTTIGTALSKQLTSKPAKELTRFLTPTLSHEIAMVLTHSLTRAPMDDYFCYYCMNHELYCTACRAAMTKDYYQDVYIWYYAHFYSTYYAAHYSGEYGDNFIDQLLKEYPIMHPPKNVGHTSPP